LIHRTCVPRHLTGRPSLTATCSSRSHTRTLADLRRACPWALSVSEGQVRQGREVECEPLAEDGQLGAGESSEGDRDELSADVVMLWIIRIRTVNREDVERDVNPPLWHLALSHISLSPHKVIYPPHRPRPRPSCLPALPTSAPSLTTNTPQLLLPHPLLLFRLTLPRIYQ